MFAMKYARPVTVSGTTGWIIRLVGKEQSLPSDQILHESWRQVDQSPLTIVRRTNSGWFVEIRSGTTKVQRQTFLGLLMHHVAPVTA